MSSAALLAAVLLAAGNAKPESQHRRALDVIATRCHLAPSVFKRDRKGGVHFQPSPGAKVADVDCALKAAQAAHLYNKVAYIGQETYEPEKK